MKRKPFQTIKAAWHLSGWLDPRILNSEKLVRGLPWALDSWRHLVVGPWAGGWHEGDSELLSLRLKTWAAGVCFHTGGLPDHAKVFGMCWALRVVTQFMEQIVQSVKTMGTMPWKGISHDKTFQSNEKNLENQHSFAWEFFLWTLDSRWSHWSLVAHKARGCAG